jgi:hypothetical protein
MDGERIVVCGREYVISVVERNYVASENWPAMRVAFLVSDGTIVVEESGALQHLVAAIEDIQSERFNLVPLTQ